MLERRELLSGQPANLIARCDGLISGPGDVEHASIVISPGNFNLPNKNVLLGFELMAANGSSLDAAAVKLQDATGNVVPAGYLTSDLPGSKNSLVIDQLGYGTYQVAVTGDHESFGSFELDVLLIGDVNGDHTVNQADGTAILGMLGSVAGNAKYQVSADANLDGHITALDYSFWQRNVGDSTSVSPLTLSAALSPAVTTVKGVPFESTSSVNVVGTTLPDATVSLDTNGAGTYSAGTVTAGANGFFSIPVSLTEGSNSLSVRARDSFGQTQVAPLAVNLDTTPPKIAIVSPSTAVTTNNNFTVTGTVTDAGSGVALLQAQVDGGPKQTVPVANGVFQFTTQLALDGTADGPHVIHVTAADNLGNVSPATNVSFTLDTVAPTVTITGPASGQRLNHNATITGQALDSGSGVALLEESVDGGAYSSVGLDTSGNFSLPTTFALDASADGLHTIALKAVDKAGNPSAIASFSFTLDTIPPTITSLNLAAGTADLGAEDTSAGRVTLVGQTEPGAELTLLGTSLTALATGSGSFQIPGVSLSPGVNALSVQAADAVGNTSQATLTVTRGATTSQPNAVIVWNQATLNAIQTDGTDPVKSSRALAMVQAAVYDAVNNVAGDPAYYVTVPAPADSSIVAAVDAAAHDVLGYLYPAQQATFDALLSSQLALLPTGQATTDGETVGQAVGNAIIALRANDGSTSYVDFEPGTAAGDWQPTPPMYAPALDPQWGNLTPFALASPNQFDPAGPPALTSQQWADAVNQVESLGAVNSTTRTSAQTTLAQFWNDGVGTDTPSGHWNAIAQTVAQQEGDSLTDDARLFAELDISMADAGIATWNTKYLYDTWRPITVIQSGGDGVNPDVTADPTWTSLLTNPNFPEYVSGHSAFSMAAATVLDSVFGDNVTFTSTEPTTSLALTYNSFQQAATDAGMSRLYGGIHFLFSIQDGWTLGAQVATWDLATFNVAKDTTPPKVTLDHSL